eukprot:3555850-Amphidinium_carterae.1
MSCPSPGSADRGNASPVSTCRISALAKPTPHCERRVAVQSISVMAVQPNGRKPGCELTSQTGCSHERCWQAWLQVHCT